MPTYDPPVSDDPLYRRYQDLHIRHNRLRRQSVMWFALSIALAAVLLLLAMHFNTRAGLPDWSVPAGVIIGVASRIAFRYWNFDFLWLRSSWLRAIFFVACYLGCGGIAYWINPQNSNGWWSVFFAFLNSLILGQYLALCVTFADSLSSDRKTNRIVP